MKTRHQLKRFIKDVEVVVTFSHLPPTAPFFHASTGVADPGSDAEVDLLDIKRTDGLQVDEATARAVHDWFESDEGYAEACSIAQEDEEDARERAAEDRAERAREDHLLGSAR